MRRVVVCGLLAAALVALNQCFRRAPTRRPHARRREAPAAPAAPATPCLVATAADTELLAKKFTVALGPAWETEPCDEAPPSAATRVHIGFGGTRLGLVNQYRILAHALAKACLEGASLVIDLEPATDAGWRRGLRPGFKADLSNSVTTPSARWREAVDLEPVRKFLKSDQRCSNTRIVSPTCAVQWSRAARIRLCEQLRGMEVMDPPDPPECREGRDMRSVSGDRGACGQTRELKRLKTFLLSEKFAPPASLVSRWAPRDASVRLDEPYIAVHFNLDCKSPRPKLRRGVRRVDLVRSRLTLTRR